VLGRILASFIMIMGYGIIAVPTGIFSVELHHAAQMNDARACANCQTPEKDRAARFCRHCGQALG
jgi:voltage-gated potassium channel